MDTLRASANIGNLCGEAIPEVFAKTLDQVWRNISDINTSATQKRQIVLKVTFAPSESREVGDVSFTCEAKLASIKPTNGNFFIAKRTKDDVRGYARDPKQDELFAQEKPPTPTTM